MTQEPTHITVFMTNQGVVLMKPGLGQTKSVWRGVSNSSWGIRKPRLALTLHVTSVGCHPEIAWNYAELDQWLQGDKDWQTRPVSTPRPHCSKSSKDINARGGTALTGMCVLSKSSQCYLGTCSGITLKKQVTFGDGEGWEGSLSHIWKPAIHSKIALCHEF